LNVLNQIDLFFVIFVTVGNLMNCRQISSCRNAHYEVLKNKVSFSIFSVYLSTEKRKYLKMMSVYTLSQKRPPFYILDNSAKLDRF